jgi:hypothetical protein
MPYCSAPECEREARPGCDYCAGHQARLRRGQPLVAPLVEPYPSSWARVHDAAVDLGNSETDEDHDRNSDRLRKAIRAYMLDLGWRPLK